jgi:hypothetical protein
MGEYADLYIDSEIGGRQSGEEDSAFMPHNDYRPATEHETACGVRYLLRNFKERYNEEVTVMHKTAKAVLFENKQHNRFWIPASVLMKKNRENFKFIIYVPDWCEIKFI